MANLPSIPTPAGVGAAGVPVAEWMGVSEARQQQQMDDTVNYLTQETFSIPVFSAGTATANKLMSVHVAANAYALPVGLAGSKGYVNTKAGTADTMVLLAKNTTTNVFGSIIFGTAANAASAYSNTASVSFAAGDILFVLGNTVSNTAAADWSVNIKGIRL